MAFTISTWNRTRASAVYPVLPLIRPVRFRHLGLLTNSAKRSINLALSYRGQCGLQNVGVLDKVMAQVVTMKNRAIHVPGESVKFIPYGVGDQAIYSVSRSFINCTLLEELTQECAKTHRCVLVSCAGSRVPVCVPALPLPLLSQTRHSIQHEAHTHHGGRRGHACPHRGRVDDVEDPAGHRR